MQELFLHQHVTHFTRFRSNHEPSVLDYVITDDGNLIDEIHYDAPLGKSDHPFLSWFTTLHVKHLHSLQVKLNFWKSDYLFVANKVTILKINEALSALDWKATFCNKSVEEMWTSFKETILRLTKLHVPAKKDHKSRKNNWISKATIKQMKLRSAALKKYRQYLSVASLSKRCEPVSRKLFSGSQSCMFQPKKITNQGKIIGYQKRP